MTVDPQASREPASIRATLAEGSLEVVRMLPAASNATLRCEATGADGSLACVFKPVAGERPLWDFPDATLTGREVAAYEVAHHLGWPRVPTTVWRADSDWGPGMCQLWIEEVEEDRPVDVFDPGEVPPGWVVVLEAHDGRGRPVVLAHTASEDLLAVAVFDAIINNADRKGGHLLADREGRVWAIDHGVCFSEDPKLRTVLWGWAGAAIPDTMLGAIDQLDADLRSGLDPVDRWLQTAERTVLRSRVRGLLADGRLPRPGSGWPAVPWPVF